LREIQNTTESDSDSDINCETGDIVEDSGWETSNDSDYSRAEQSKTVEWQLIKLANQKANLGEVLKDLNISHTNVVYSPSGWTHNYFCPFKDHHDKSPSFWYNPSENRFNCFGCSRGGKAVIFLSIYSNKKQIDVAKELLKKYGNLDDIYEDINDELQIKIDKLVLESSEYFKKFIKNHENNQKLIQFAENLFWSLDIYLEKLNLMKSDIEIENLEARLNIIKRKLQKFE